MSYFSAKKSIKVDSEITHLAQAPKDPYLGSLLEAVTKPDDIPTKLLMKTFTGMGIKVDKYFHYGENNFYLGLPKGGTIRDVMPDDQSIAWAIEAAEDLPTSAYVLGAQFLTAAPNIIAYPFLVNVREYSPITDEVSVFPNDIVWPANVNKAGDVAPRKVKVNKISLGVDEVSIDIKYDLYQSIPVLKGTLPNATIQDDWVLIGTQIENIVVPLINTIPSAKKLLLAMYKICDSEGVPQGLDQVWLYDLSTNTFPNLDPANGDPDDQRYLPIVPIRRGGVTLTDVYDKDSTKYKTSAEILNILKLNFQELGDKLNASPSINNIENCYVIFAAQAISDHPAVMKYLHSFFLRCFENQVYNEFTYIEKVGAPAFDGQPVPAIGASPIQTQHVTNKIVARGGGVGIKEAGFDLEIEFDYIRVINTEGSTPSGRVGSISRDSIKYKTAIVYGYKPDGTPLYTSKDKSVLVLKKQIATNVLEEVHVYGLEVTSDIYKGETIVGTLEDNKSNCIIPLQYDIAESIGLQTANDLYAECLLLVTTSVTITKTYWYQRGFFKVLIFVVMLIIAAYTQQWYLLSWAELLLQAAIQIVINLLVGVVADWLVTKYGAELGFAGAAILAVLALVASQGSAGIDIFGQFVSAAPVCLQLAQAIISEANEFLVGAAQGIINEYAAFSAHLAERYKELKTTQDLLAMKGDFDPLNFTKQNKLRPVIGETPSQFYARTLELPAATMFTIHAEIPNYVSQKLTLPRLPNWQNSSIATT